jgi:hypothetical protein
MHSSSSNEPKRAGKSAQALAARSEHMAALSIFSLVDDDAVLLYLLS